MIMLFPLMLLMNYTEVDHGDNWLDRFYEEGIEGLKDRQKWQTARYTRTESIRDKK